MPITYTVSKTDALAYGIDYKISEHLIIHQPTLRDIIAYDAQEYIKIMMTMTSRPYDSMVYLYDMGKDYRKIDEYHYFLEIIVPLLVTVDLSILFGDFSFNDYMLMNRGNELVLYNGVTQDVFDKSCYEKLVDFIRSMHFFPADTEYNVGNDITYEFIIRRERRKLKKLSKKPKEEFTTLNDMASYLIWCSNGSYNWNSIQDITIYQLHEGVRRSQADKKFANISNGIYAGTVDSSKIKFEDIEPLRHFNNKERKITND